MEPVETRRCSRRLRPRNTPVGRRSRAHPWRERCRREVSEEKADGGSEPTSVWLQSTLRLVVLSGMTEKSVRLRRELMPERRQERWLGASRVQFEGGRAWWVAREAGASTSTTGLLAILITE